MNDNTGCKTFQYLFKNFDTFRLIIEYLRKNDICVNMNMVDNMRWTPLHYACLYGNIHIVEMLISYHETTNSTLINLNARDFNQQTPIQIANYYGNKNIVDFLKVVIKLSKGNW